MNKNTKEKLFEAIKELVEAANYAGYTWGNYQSGSARYDINDVTESADRVYKMIDNLVIMVESEND